MNKNINFEENQHKINDLNQYKHKLLQEINRKQQEIQQIDVEIMWLNRDNCIHNLIKSPELVWTEENVGEVVFKEEWCCTQCLYKELRGVE